MVYLMKFQKFSICFLLFLCPFFVALSQNKNSAANDLADSVSVAGNPALSARPFKKAFLGKNYRNEWITPVKVPVLKLGTAFGGLTPIKEGGGKQTHTLQVENKEGTKWALRSIKKYPEAAIPDEAKHTIAEKIVNDAISASYPYGALSSGELAKAAQVPYFRDSLVYIPDDAALGKYREKYKNSLVLMEDKKPTTFFKEMPDPKLTIISSDELFYKLADKGAIINQEAVLQARLLDNFMMDFDRHEQQREWIKLDDDKTNTWYPVAKDRDQVFFINSGLLPHVVKGKNILPELEGFHKKAEHIETFNRPARNFDRFFLNGLSQQQWSSQVDRFLLTMTDEVIENALHKQPKEIQSFAAQKIINTLKEKRKYFKDDMMKYYRFLSKTVSITGTNAADVFSIIKNEDGTAQITVTTKNKKDSADVIRYSRVFDASETEEIRLYGLEADDKFLNEGAASKIKFRFIGGPGNDEFTSTGRGKKMLAYDVNFEQNNIKGKGIKSEINSDPQNNTYTRLSYLYNKRSVGPALEYASDGGLFLGIKFNASPQGFRVSPYRSKQNIAFTRAINSSSYHIKYIGDFVSVLRHTNLFISGDVNLPTSKTGFYGIGNTSIYDKTNPSLHKYYLALYSLGNLSFSFRNTINSWLTLKGGPVFKYFNMKTDDNENKYISTVYSKLPLSNNALHAQYYAGAETGLDVNTSNSKLFPTRGILFNATAQTFFGLNNYSNQHTQASANFSFYTDFIAKKHLVLASAFGGGHNFTKYQFYQAQMLGFKENLRGYRIQRFAGYSRAYNNTELRWYMGNVNLYLVKGPFGILGFNDVGRVWAKNEKSGKWHDGYGGGIWLAPFNKVLFSACVTYSAEEKNLLLINTGFQF